MAEDHRAPEVGKLNRVWDRGRRETANCQRASDAGQCRMRGEVSWDGCPQVLQEGFSILLILER